MERDILEKILAILQAQDAKIKALEAELEAYSGGVNTLIDTIYDDKDTDAFEEFSAKHRGKFEPYLSAMDSMEGGDSFRIIYDKTKELDNTEGYDEDAYIDAMLANVVQIINELKAIVPAEAAESLNEAEAAIAEAADEAKEPELFQDGEIKDPAQEEWTEEELAKIKPEGRQFYR